MKSSGIEVAKIASSIAVEAVTSAVPFFGLLKKGVEGVVELLERQNEERREEFIRGAYEGRVFPENAEGLTAEDLVGMFRVCLADFENEKAALYGRLAGAIAVGEVAREHRHPLMLSLTQLTYAQVDRLRKSYIATKYPLMPSGGTGHCDPGGFFLGRGHMDGWDAEKLAGLFMIKDSRITDLARQLVEACFTADDLTPEAIGARAWLNPDAALGQISYDMDDQAVLRVHLAFTDVARGEGLKAGSLFAPKDRQRVKWSFGLSRCFVIFVGRNSWRLLEHVSLLRAEIDKGYQPIIVFLDTIDTEVQRAFPEARVVKADGDAASAAEAVMALVAEVLIELKEMEAGVFLGSGSQG